MLLTVTDGKVPSSYEPSIPSILISPSSMKRWTTPLFFLRLMR